MEGVLQNIAIFCGGLKRAGLERVVCDLSIGMKEAGVNVSVFSILGGDLEDELKKHGVDVKVLVEASADKYHSSILKSILLTIRLAAALKAKRIQAINIHGLGAERIGLAAANRAGVRLKTFVFHSNYPALDSGDGNKKLKLRLTRDLRSVQHCIAVSEEVRRFVVGGSVVEEPKISVIHNGVRIHSPESLRSRQDVRSGLGLSDKDTVLIQVGRFQPPKNQDISVMAMKRVVERCPSTHLLFVGAGPDFGKTRELAEKAGLLSHIHFLGIRSDVPDLLQASDLFLLPSSWEGLPVSLLEAFASSLPVIGADVPGIRDTVELERSCAKLVKAGDPEALANAVVEAINDTAWRAVAQKSAFSIVTHHFDLSRAVGKYIDLHRTLFQNIGA